MTGRRVLALILACVALVAVISITAVAVIYRIVTGGPEVPQGATLVLRPGGALPEEAPDDLVGTLVDDGAPTVRGFVESLRKARRDPRIANVLLLPASLDSPYWAKVQEMRDAVADFRASGKPVVAFLEYGGDREYYLASAADRVFLLPTSPLDLTGVASYEVFLRGALDTIGAYPDFVHVGDYKTAVNQLTEKGFTPAHREMTTSLNRDAYDQLVRGIAVARKKGEADVRRLIDEGPFAPEAALAAGLVDELAYEDQLDERMRQLHLSSGELRRVEGAAYERVSDASLGVRPQARIAVVPVIGTIVSGESGFDAGSGRVVGSATVVEAIRRARADDSIRAIVLRVDSPGGSSVASDVIWRELMLTRRQKPSRPIIASMSDLAASGGYYVSMAAHAIVAEPGTLTGSIGVFMGKVALGGTAAKVGVSTETVTSGANADIYSPFTPFTPVQRQKLGEYMQVFYQGFVEKAAEARHSSPQAIDQVARGRVWTGVQARDRGLVDALGGFETAVALAKQRAKIPAGDDVELVTFAPKRGLYEAVAAQFGRASVGSGLFGPFHGLLDRQALASATIPMRLFRRGEPLALMPFAVSR